jgi:hypothetical protein
MLFRYDCLTMTRVTNEKNVYIAFGMSDGNLYLILNGWALQKGLIGNEHCQKIITFANKLNISSTRIRVELDTELDVSSKGKNLFTIPETIDYVSKFSKK